jgi:hypothetical protein
MTLWTSTIQSRVPVRARSLIESLAPVNRQAGSPPSSSLSSLNEHVIFGATGIHHGRVLSGGNLRTFRYLDHPDIHAW